MVVNEYEYVSLPRLNAFSAQYDVYCGNACLAFFPSKNEEHVSFSIVIFGIPVTSSLFTIDRIASRPM